MLPLLRSLCSTAAGKSRPSSFAFTESYWKPLRFSSSTGFTRLLSSSSDNVVDDNRLRNVAEIADVDHGKTAVMDRLLRQCGADIPHERALDSIELERERDVTIASKISLARSASSQVNLEESIREAVEAKTYAKIPELLNASKKSCQNPNPFLEVRQFVLAGKFVVRMTERGFIPYIRVRQRVFEGLVTIGETELATC